MAFKPFTIIKDKVAQVRGAASNRIDELSSREKIMLLAMFSTISFLVLSGTTWYVSSTLGEMEEIADDSQQKLIKIVQSRETYTANKAKMERMTAKLKNIERNFQLFKFLEDKAKEDGITLTDLKDRGVTGTTRDKEIREHIVEVNLQKISLNTLAKFLYQIESSPYLLKIRKLRVRATSKDEEPTLNVSFSVATYKVNHEIVKKSGGSKPKVKTGRRGRPPRRR